jgi:REP element-mobilizing transposase RayT
MKHTTKQTSFLGKPQREHGGSLSLNKRRSRRPLNIREPVHLVLRSDLARGSRSLLRHQQTVHRVLHKFARRFRIRVYEKAICGNHIHCLVKAQTRRELQHFFRVFAGQVAQEILKQFPLTKSERARSWGGTPARRPHPKNRRSFWSVSLYSRVVSWGREFRAVKGYVLQNTLEALGLIAYQTRRLRRCFGAVPPPGSDGGAGPP